MLRYRGKELKDFNDLESKEYLLVEGKYEEIVQIQRDFGGKNCLVKLGSEIENYDPLYFKGELCDIVIHKAYIDDSKFSESVMWSETHDPRGLDELIEEDIYNHLLSKMTEKQRENVKVVCEYFKDIPPLEIVMRILNMGFEKGGNLIKAEKLLNDIFENNSCFKTIEDLLGR